MIRKKSDLQPGQKWLVETMQAINFGTISGLLVVGGEPTADPPPRLVRELRLPGENGPRPETRMSDFELREQIVELLREIERLGTGTIDLIEVRHGVPFRVFLETQV